MFYAKKLLILLDFEDFNHLQVETQNKHKLSHFDTEILKVSQIFVSILIKKMPRKKTKQKNLKKGSKIVKITNLAPKSFFSNASSNYKKNKELNKIKAIKLEKLQEKNRILKERKDLKAW